MNKNDLALIRAIKESGTAFDRISGWYMYGDKYVALSPVEEKQRDRYRFTFTQLRNGRSNEFIVKRLMDEYDIKESQAYVDIREAKKLFGDINKADAEGERHIHYEMAMFAWREARKTNDLKEMNKAMGNIIKIKKYDKESDDNTDRKPVGANNYYLVLSAGESNVQLNLNNVSQLGPRELSEIQSSLREVMDQQESQYLNEYIDTTFEQVTDV